MTENRVPPKWFIMVYHGLSWFIMVYHHVQIENLGNLVPSHRLPTSPRVFLGDMKVLDFG